MESIISIKNVFHQYSGFKEEIKVLNDVNISINDGDFVTIQGPSGSGKSTLLNLLGGFMKPTTGTIEVNQFLITNMNENQLSLYRRKNIGFIFQSYHLFQNMNALNNVEEPLFYAGVKKKERMKRAYEMLERVGLADRAMHQPHELSGGQQQRVSIARALVTNPKIILADEPTGNLDSNTEDEILDLIKHINKDLGKTIVMVTHNEKVVKLANRRFEIKGGNIM